MIDDPGVVFYCWPLQRSLRWQRAFGHESFFFKFLFERRYSRADGLIVFFSSQRFEWHATWPTWASLGQLVALTWGQIWPWPFKVKKYIFRCVSTRKNTMVLSLILYLSYFESYSWKTVLPFDLKWPLVTWILILAKNDWGTFLIIFWRAFDRFFFCFSLRALGAELRGGRGLRDPPPISAWFQLYACN